MMMMASSKEGGKGFSGPFPPPRWMGGFSSPFPPHGRFGFVAVVAFGTMLGGLRPADLTRQRQTDFGTIGPADGKRSTHDTVLLILC